MSKRRHGEGNIRHRADGRWEARYTYADPETGEIRRESAYGATAKKARDAMRRALERIQEGVPPRDSSRTVASWVQEWLQTSLVASPRKDSTKQLYRVLAPHLTAEPLGPKRLDRLRPSDIEALLLHLHAKPGTRRVGTGSDGQPQYAPMSPATIQRLFVLLRLVVDGAVRDGLLARNPARLVKQPSVPRAEAAFLTDEQTRLVLQDARASRAYPVLALIAMTGLRRGEALALTWADVDHEASVLHVRRSMSRVDGELVSTSPKTTKSRRTLPMSPQVSDLLRAHRDQQDAERSRACNLWQDSDLVFTTELGQPMDPRNVLRTVSRSAERVGIAHPVGVHSLRHSAATAMLEAGVNLKAVSDLLGHTDIRMTANTYGHVSDATATAAMHALGTAMGNATGPPAEEPDSGLGSALGSRLGSKPDFRVLPETGETKSPYAATVFLGGAEGTRTPDPLHAMEVRYQLRYSPDARLPRGLGKHTGHLPPRMMALPIVREGGLGEGARVVFL